MSIFHTTNALSKWTELLNFAYKNIHSDFYHHRFNQANFQPARDFNSLQAISLVPVLTKDELIKTSSANELLFVPEKEIWAISSTSGTTSGTPLTTFLSPSPYATRKSAFSDTARVLIIFSPLRITQVQYLLKLREQLTIIGDVHNLPATAALAAQTKVSSIIITPSMAIIFKKYLAAYPALAKNLECLTLVGEALSPAKKRLLHELYPGVRMYSTYASSEAGRAGWQCPHLADEVNATYFHANIEGHSFEVMETNSEKLCPNGEAGELVLTDFTNLGTPTIRYRTGDLVRFVGHPCACGLQEPLFEVLGRAARDFVRAGGFELRRDMVEVPILHLRDIISEDFTVHVHEEYQDTRPIIQISLDLALRDNVKDTPEIRLRIKQVFSERWRLSPNLTLEAAINSKLFSPLKINFTNFPKMPKANQRIILD